jgi:class 3 adenylate cyclase
MSLKEEIKLKAKEIKDTDFSVESVSYIPNISNSKLTFGCTGLIFPATVLYIDMRGSTKVLNSHNKRTTAKIHMTYYHAIVKVAKSDEGEIRSFNGDSLLVFFYGSGYEVARKAVSSAMKIKYALTNIVNETLSEFPDIDFGIGIDCGNILATKVGVGGDSDNKDLIWIGNAVNRATKISDECKASFHIGISQAIYDKLDDSLLYYDEKNIYGNIQKKNVWNRDQILYNDNNEFFYKSKCLIPFI